MHLFVTVTRGIIFILISDGAEAAMVIIHFTMSVALTTGRPASGILLLQTVIILIIVAAQKIYHSRSGSITDGSGPVQNYMNNNTAYWLIDPQTIYDSITSITLTFAEFDLLEGD